MSSCLMKCPRSTCRSASRISVSKDSRVGDWWHAIYCSLPGASWARDYQHDLARGTATRRGQTSTTEEHRDISRKSSVRPCALCGKRPLPTPRLQHMRFVDPGNGQPLHRTYQILADFEQYFRILIMRSGLHNGLGPLLGFLRIGESGGIFHEDAGAYENGFCS